jgi:hypothetical protein
VRQKKESRLTANSPRGLHRQYHRYAHAAKPRRQLQTNVEPRRMS